jgi:uncharacterized protein YqjF (DUF2071 family)
VTDPSRAPFLTAKWVYLVMLNYVVEPAVLAPYVPRGTELDAWSGWTYVSFVGFLFQETRVLGLPALFHRTFAEVNLRFYVTRTVGATRRHGVVFLREFVARPLVAVLARLSYNEPYRTVPMRYDIRHAPPPRQLEQVEYAWRSRGSWCRLVARTDGPPQSYAHGSEQQFISERGWGYTRQRDGSTVEYEVEHPPWRIWRTVEARVEGDPRSSYEPAFAVLLAKPPASAFVADGSFVRVHRPARLIAD